MPCDMRLCSLRIYPAGCYTIITLKMYAMKFLIAVCCIRAMLEENLGDFRTLLMSDASKSE